MNLNKIKRLITDTKKDIYLIKHSRRKNALKELDKTSRCGMEPKYYVKKFKKIIQNIKFNSQLPDLTTFLRKVDVQYNKIFTKIYKIELKNKLCRDQNIIQYAFYVLGCESELFYFKSGKNLRNTLQKKICPP